MLYNHSGDGDGAWSTDGCNVVSRSSNGIVCECDHLTNFAILMTPSEMTDVEHNATLGIISVVGCAVSLACLMLTLLGHLSCLYCDCGPTTLLLLDRFLPYVGSRNMDSSICKVCFRTQIATELVIATWMV
ncbi:hypothetical protein CHS0354_027128 [Potamilus streckersoni]|uniref:GAIN-B domain-containing protein n=1 Tax=Potamilus streckersoni TaxID=2493646 RepID=A0AAE0VIL8_9BIVA|nr:hypothetical protein CHS0354_027128 [Potamilus streckersoni]